MSFEKMNFLLSLATAQEVKVETVKEFAEFVRRMKV